MSALLCNTRISTERAPCQRSQVLNELKLWNKLELDELTAVKDSFKLTPTQMLSICPSLEDNVNTGVTMVEPLHNHLRSMAFATFHQAPRLVYVLQCRRFPVQVSCLHAHINRANVTSF